MEQEAEKSEAATCRCATTGRVTRAGRRRISGVIEALLGEHAREIRFGPARLMPTDVRGPTCARRLSNSPLERSFPVWGIENYAGVFRGRKLGWD